LILDMVEALLVPDRDGQLQYREASFQQFFEQVLRATEMPSRLILTSQDKLPSVAQGRYNEYFYEQRLAGLTIAEALELFAQWEVIARGNQDRHILQRFIAAYEGHPLALRVIAGEIVSDYDRDIQAYWHEFGHEIEAVEQMRQATAEWPSDNQPRLDRYSIPLRDLVKKRVEQTFQRLYRAHPLACLLLCMGAAARRALEREGWLFLISEYPSEDQQAAFQALQRRFLLESEQSKHRRRYRLHSLIRSVASEHLLQLEETF
ncbi:MAG: ATP-binding protein, partial [Spirulinaceae cyanobacterium RM2_2_10]|nr:ATP-binding protein [Spirulinaceae cyanobacterium RM2_2_10]